MIVYYSLLVGASISAMVSDLSKARTNGLRIETMRRRSWNVVDLVIVCALIAVSGSRYYVGTDFFIYRGIYNDLNPDDWARSIALSPHEVGFTVFSLIIKSVSADPSALIWATSVALVIPTYVAIKRLSVNPALSLFLYIALGFYFTGFNQIRQSIALSVTLLAYSYLKQSTKRSKVVYCLLIALSVSFHVSAIVVPILHLITARWQATKWRIFLLAAAVAVLGLALASLSSVASSFNDRYGGYISGAETAGFGTLIIAGIRLAVVLWSVTARKNHAMDADTNRYSLYVAVSVGLVLLGYISVPVARTELYFSAYMIFLIPALASKSKISRTLTWVIVVLGLIYMYFNVSTFNGVLPYQTVNGFTSGSP
jgi:transmembrane protein EpsG